MSKRNTKDHPLTKGGALIQAREILGPSASVGFSMDECVVFTEYSYHSGETWEAALELAQESPQAQAWKDTQMSRDNELAEARNSLLSKTKEYLKDSKLMKLLSRSEMKFVLGSLRSR